MGTATTAPRGAPTVALDAVGFAGSAELKWSPSSPLPGLGNETASASQPSGCGGSEAFAEAPHGGEPAASAALRLSATGSGLRAAAGRFMALDFLAAALEAPVLMTGLAATVAGFRTAHCISSGLMASAGSLAAEDSGGCPAKAQSTGNGFQ